MPERSSRSHSAIRAGDATAVSSLFQRQGPAGSNPALRTIFPFRRGRAKTRRRPDMRGARPDRTGSLRLTGQDTALSRRQCGFDSRRDRISARSNSPRRRQRGNVPERSIRPRSASRAGDAAADIPVLETGVCGFESRPAHHLPSPPCAGDATAVSSLFEEQGPAGSNPALRTFFPFTRSDSLTGKTPFRQEGSAAMCLSVRYTLTPPYAQVMQRQTSLFQEQRPAGSNPALRTILLFSFVWLPGS